MESMTIQEFVNLYRSQYSNLTEFARDLGITQSTISKYKNGQLQPNKKTAYRIFNQFGIIIKPFSEEGLIDYGFNILKNKGR